MVSERWTTRGERDRGQLILVAAISIAFIILGIVVVFNSTLYTQSISSGESIDQSADAKAVELEVERGIRGLTQEVNRKGGADDVAENVSAFVDTHRNVTAASRPSLVDVGVNHDTNGTIVQGSGGLATRGDDNESTVFSTADNTSIEHFVLELETEADQFETMTMNLSDDGTWTNGSIEYDGDNVTIDVDGESCELAPTDERVTVDLLRGHTNADTSDGCLESVATTVDGSYDEALFTNDGDADAGSFELVLAADVGDVDTDFETEAAAVTLEVQFTYESSDLSFERSSTVDVYGAGDRS